jgi:hypothetical protein
MGMGYAFALFLVIIVVVPIAGLIWFALDEIFTDGGRGREASEGRRHRA